MRYPPKLQSQVSSDYFLKEDDRDLFRLDYYLSVDIECGWAKLIGGIQLIAFIKQYWSKGYSLSLVTVYGPRENETHAIIMLIYKAFECMDSYVIWDSGEQERDFTYLEDIVEEILLVREKVTDRALINLGTGTKYKN